MTYKVGDYFLDREGDFSRILNIGVDGDDVVEYAYLRTPISYSGKKLLEWCKKHKKELDNSRDDIEDICIDDFENYLEYEEIKLLNLSRTLKEMMEDLK